MKLAVTGAHGFIGRNLCLRLAEMGHTQVQLLAHTLDEAGLVEQLQGVQCVFHLAGVNRPPDPEDFAAGNAGFTQRLGAALARLPHPVRVVYSSSTQAELDNAYGRSKRAAEEALLMYARLRGAPVHLYRLPNVFGKWSRPDYNSAVATFCHRVARGLPITVNDPAAPLRLVYIDDVVQAFCAHLSPTAGDVADNKAVDNTAAYGRVSPTYETTVGELARLVQDFARSRDSLVTAPVGTGLVRALYATYVSFLPTESFAYEVPRHGDARGVFVEMLKTGDSGQFSYFTAHPGVTRGEHYHHTKTEKFLVIRGQAHFGFRHVLTDERHEIVVQGGDGRIVETVPGWTHNITNIGSDELIVMLWANEVFDRERPDTRACKV